MQTLRLRPMSAARLLEEQERGALIVDTRAAEAFARLHARGAVQIGLVGPFASWAAILLHPRQKVLLVADDSRHAQEARIRLSRVGLLRVIGYALADPGEWRIAGIELVSFPTRRSEDIFGSLRSDPSLQLVDVRSRAEWLKGHLPGAVSLPLLHLRPGHVAFDRRITVPSRRTFVYCREGFRATTAASLLLRQGAGAIGVVIDGFDEWSRLGLPLQVPELGVDERLDR